MKILITGIGGFVGPYLKKLFEENNHEVFGIERTKKNDESAIFYGDILDERFIEISLREAQPDYIAHLAGFSSVRNSFDGSELCMKVNVQGTENILKAAKKQKKRPRILTVTSAEVYGEPKFIPITEEHPLNPSSPYGKSRLEQEKLIGTYTNDLEIVIVRSFNHTGPGQKPNFVIPNFIQQIVEIEKGQKDPQLSVGNLSAIRDFTDVRDVVRAYHLALQKGKSGEKYNICSGTGYGIQEILDYLIQNSQCHISVQQDENRIRPSDIPKLIGSNMKFTLNTGWKPTINLWQTLNDMLHWFRFNN